FTKLVSPKGDPIHHLPVSRPPSPLRGERDGVRGPFRARMQAVAEESFPHCWTGEPQPLGDLGLIALGQPNGLAIKFALDPVSEGGLQVCELLTVGRCKQLGNVDLKASFRLRLGRVDLLQRLANDL